MTHKRVRSVVKITRTSDSPSTPIKYWILNVGTQENFSTNWKSEVPELKFAQSQTDARNAAPLAMTATSRTSWGFSLGRNSRASAPTKGNKVINESTDIAASLVFTDKTFHGHHHGHQGHGDHQKVILHKTILDATRERPRFLRAPSRPIHRAIDDMI